MSTITPKSRREHFLSKIADGRDEIQPKSRREQFLDRIASDKKTKSEKFVVTFSGENDNEENTSACDKTFAEIKAAYDEGLNVEARYGNYVLHLVYASAHNFTYYCYFKTDFEEETVYEINVVIADDDSVDVRVGGDV